MKRLSRRFRFMLALPLLFTACSSNYKDQAYKPLIIDTAGLLNQKTTAWLTARSYPKGFAFVIRTVKNLSQKEVGSAADVLFTEDVKKCPDPKACANRGVYIIISQEPALIQVRVGSELAVQARWAGITSGQKYIQEQSLSTSGNFDEGLQAIIEWLSTALPQAINISWLKRWVLLDITQSLYRELNNLSLPSEGFYGNHILKPFLQARIWEERFSGTWWITYLIASGFVLAVGFIIRTTVNVAIGGASASIANGMNFVLSILLNLGLAIPSAASVILLSGSRLEDQIAVRASGIPGAESFTFSTQSFVMETGILLALLLLILRIAKGFADSATFIAFASLPNDKQQEIFSDIKEKNPAAAWVLKAFTTTEDNDVIGYAASESDFDRAPFAEASTRAAIDTFKAGARWGLLAWLMLPRALTLITMCLWIIPIAGGGLRYLITKHRISSNT